MIENIFKNNNYIIKMIKNQIQKRMRIFVNKNFGINSDNNSESEKTDRDFERMIVLPFVPNLTDKIKNNFIYTLLTSCKMYPKNWITSSPQEKTNKQRKTSHMLCIEYLAEIVTKCKYDKRKDICRPEWANMKKKHPLSSAP